MSNTDTGTGTEPQQPLGDEAAAERLTSAPLPERPDDFVPSLGVVGWVRWTWRQLTSMRVALILLFLLSLAAVPGSLIPQTSANALKVEAWKADHTTVAPIYEKLQLFHVYSSSWFSAIYILLFISLAGCIIPRSWQFVGVLRSRPPAAPRNLTRMPAYATWRTSAAAEDVTAAAEGLLRRRRFRAHASRGAVASEKGYLREVGNLLFHISLFGLLIAVAWSSLSGGQGGKLVLEGQGFANTATQYDDFEGSALYGPNDLAPFGLTLDGFTATYQTTGDQLGTPRDFTAHIHYWTGTDSSKTRKAVIQVNHPLEVGGDQVYLIGHGFSPVVTVKNTAGVTVFHGPTPFLPQDTNLTSTGAIKVGDYGAKDGKHTQLGFTGYFLPTAPTTMGTAGPQSLFPAPAAPALILNAYAGDLGTDSGLPQNVYQLDTSHMTQLKEDGAVTGKELQPGQGWILPDGYGTVSFDGYQQWATFTIAHRPGNAIALVSALCAVLGLIGSLLLRRRRVWVRATAGADGATVVEMAALSRSESSKIAEELADLAVALQDDAPAIPDDPVQTDDPSKEGPPSEEAESTERPEMTEKRD